ncbi:MAG TPA: UDP-N-acetylmuramoylalanyl-D-glutamyl-2,6-diaminopimelate--D-alanyl-D-alanine ligase [Geminicoccaceae bacterium]
MSEAPLWTSEEIAAATRGRASGSWSVAGVSIDSRTVVPGELFVALAGPRHDGHDFVFAALQRGAAALVHRRPEGLPPRAPLVEVADTLDALQRLGAAGRNRAGGRVLAVTGSVGKTGTKEALRHVLGAQASVHASAASHNNHWGVPLSLARMPPEVRYGVFELGMNAAGEIGALTRLVRPEVALITAVEAAHLGHFASIEAIADAKGEIFAGLEPRGAAILNADSPHLERLSAHARAAGCARIITFGRADRADARVERVEGDLEGSQVTMSLGGRRLVYRIGAPGRHWVQNSLAVLAAVDALGADPGRAAAALATFHAPGGRGQQRILPWQGGHITLIDDSYNANPASMRAAFDVLGRARGRKIAVLGDMLELGAAGPSLHAELARPLAAAGADLVFTAGSLMTLLHERLPEDRRGGHAADSGALWCALAPALRPGDTVLVKGSLGSRMGVVVQSALSAADGARVGQD